MHIRVRFELKKDMEKGIESLKAAVLKDCEGGNGCFNPDGCDKEKCKCFHRYCDKYKWVLERAEQYAKLTGKTKEEVIKAWEEQRSYWYLNFYQGCNQPEIKVGSGVKVALLEDWLKELKSRFGEEPKNWKFRCPACGNIQSGQDFIDGGIEDYNGKVYSDCIGRHVKGKGCDWTLGGLFAMHKTVVVSDMKVIPVFEMAE